MPLHKVLHTPAGATIGVWRLTESEQDLLALYPDADMLLHQVNERFTAPVRRLEFIAVRVLFYTLLQRVLPIAYKSTGAPYAVDDSMNISISHTVRRTARYVSVIYHPGHAVGVDIEAVAPNVERIRSHFMHPSEQVEGLIPLLLCWSGKEAVYKLMDTPKAVDFVKSLHTQPFVCSQECREGRFVIQEQVTAEKKEYQVEYQVENEFVLTWVEE
jgi:4'-phosphopantetheinyl transferase EntD